MTRLLLALWIALIGADRLDLAGGTAPVIVTPFLALTPLVVVALVWGRWLGGRPVVVGRSALAYALLVALFLSAVGASALLSLDADTTLARAALLLIQLGGATTVAMLVHDDPRAIGALRRGAVLGVALFIVMDVLAVLALARAIPMTLAIGPATLKLESFGYASLLPRLSGTVLDPNRGGLVLLGFAFLAPRTRWWVALLVLVTLSRSATLGGIALAVAATLQFGVAHRTAPIGRSMAAIAVVAAAVLFVARSPASLDGTARMLAPFAERFGGDEGSSAAEHEALIVRAANEGSRSPSRVLLGLGWGASYMVLQDVFPGNRYGNFHSLYATVFAETGVLSLVVMLALLVLPLGRATPWRPVVVAFIVFNLSYQTTTEPVFWFLLCLAWVARSVPRTAMAPPSRELVAA